MHFLWQNE